jgi:hypothetical protein
MSAVADLWTAIVATGLVARKRHALLNQPDVWMPRAANPAWVAAPRSTQPADIRGAVLVLSMSGPYRANLLAFLWRGTSAFATAMASEELEVALCGGDDGMQAGAAAHDAWWQQLAEDAERRREWFDALPLVRALRDEPVGLTGQRATVLAALARAVAERDASRPGRRVGTRRVADLAWGVDRQENGSAARRAMADLAQAGYATATGRFGAASDWAPNERGAAVARLLAADPDVPTSAGPHIFQA